MSQRNGLSRRTFLKWAAFAAVGTAIQACAPQATPIPPTPIKVSVGPGIQEPTKAAAAPAAPAATPVPPTVAPTTAPPAAPAAAEKPFVLNGVTLPFKRSQALVNQQVNFTVWGSFNPFIPNGHQYQNGHAQFVVEFDWYTIYSAGEFRPWRIDSFKYADNFQTLTMNIKKGITWNDGKPFTAQDYAFTINMLVKDKTLEAGELTRDREFIKEATAVDDYTLVIKTTEPKPRLHMAFYCKLTVGPYIVPKHIWEGKDPKTFKNNPPVWTGPYMLETEYKDNMVVVWKKNPNYWNKAQYNPVPDYVVYRSTPAAEQNAADIKANLIDIGGMDYKTFLDLKAKGELPDHNVFPWLDPCPRGLWFNCAKGPDISKPEFRRAMSMLCNRETWGKNIWFPPSIPAKGFWTGYPLWDKYINDAAKKKWGIFDYNPQAAVDLLKSIGYKSEGGKLLRPDGTQVAFETSTRVAPGGFEYLFGQAFVEECKKVGINTELKYYEGTVYSDKVSKGDWDLGFWWLCGASVDPIELYQNYVSSRVMPVGELATRGNQMRLTNPKLDAIVAKLAVTGLDDPAVNQLYQDAFDAWCESPAGVPLVETYYTFGFNSKYWSGMPTPEKLYTDPANWHGPIMFIAFNVKPK
jgi:peptide/nickel transport system substrate-binding protein